MWKVPCSKQRQVTSVSRCLQPVWENHMNDLAIGTPTWRRMAYTRARDRTSELTAQEVTQTLQELCIAVAPVQHSRELLHELLGLGDTEIDRLFRAGVTGEVF